MLAAITVLAAVVWMCNGCAPSNPYPPGTFDRAKHYFDNDKDLEAVAAFEAFVRHSPLDSMAAEAQYLRAKTYLVMQEYPLAAVEFQIMRKDYPNSPFVEDALFGEGEAYLFQVGRVERDLTGALEARNHFLEFSQTYPNSDYMSQVIAYLEEISDLVVKKRLEQVKVYGQLKRYSAIAIVLDDVIVKEATSSLIPEVMWERAKVAIKLDDPDTAAEMYEGIIGRYPDGDYADSAASALRNLDGDDEDDYDKDED
ncbi:MAG: outer membrane assembly lipoprotein YfiO [Candidatus Krumholzibacteriia bacterium]|jgi:outer membrane assembly lipoprotein YfiO